MKRNKSKEDYKQTEGRGFIWESVYTVSVYTAFSHSGCNALQMWINSLFWTCWKANHPFKDFSTPPLEQWYGAELSADGLKARSQLLK